MVVDIKHEDVRNIASGIIRHWADWVNDACQEAARNGEDAVRETQTMIALVTDYIEERLSDLR